ncbi:MAG: hypothetical protein A2W35_05665 [Chloroflexi bacterium RBG_16_57_11]|nr:MAG: hypothetical protein A2W35_05665 [Chloroflexi bacterium RBG_16_57_11]
MNAQTSSSELTATLQQKLILLKELRRKRAMAADFGRRFQLEMQLEHCRAEIRSLAEQIDASITAGSGAP